MKKDKAIHGLLKAPDSIIIKQLRTELKECNFIISCLKNTANQNLPKVKSQNVFNEMKSTIEKLKAKDEKRTDEILYLNRKIDALLKQIQNNI